jgi:hypothetical protein
MNLLQIICFIIVIWQFFVLIHLVWNFIGDVSEGNRKSRPSSAAVFQYVMATIILILGGL